MRTVVRWFIVVVVVGHGLIHLLGAAKGLGWAEVAALPEPIGPALGLAWLAAAAAVVATGVLLAVRNRRWWVAGTVGLVVSQAVILTSWNDAKAGTVANVLLLAALGYTFASRGPRSYRAQYQHRVAAALRESQGVPGALVTETDLAHLPGLVAEYVRRSGAGPEMDRAETVTLFNDLCILAPAALIDAPVVWQPIDDNHVRGIFTNGAQTVTADLTFDDGDLVDFVSDDRMKSSSDGSTFTPQRWSTPIRDYRTFGTRRVATHGEGRWHTIDPQGQYAYLEYNLDTITCNPARRPPRGEVRYSRLFMGGTP